MYCTIKRRKEQVDKIEVCINLIVHVWYKVESTDFSNHRFSNLLVTRTKSRFLHLSRTLKFTPDCANEFSFSLKFKKKYLFPATPPPSNLLPGLLNNNGSRQCTKEGWNDSIIATIRNTSPHQGFSFCWLVIKQHLAFEFSWFLVTVDPNWKLGCIARSKTTSWNGNFRHSPDVTHIRITFYTALSSWIIPRCRPRASKGEEFRVGCSDVEIFKVTFTAVRELSRGLHHLITEKFGWKSTKSNLWKRWLVSMILRSFTDVSHTYT